MREFKFRCFSKEENKMYEVFSFCKDFVKVVAEGVGDGILKFPITGFEIMQYTGLKDKNGKEIYEGDIIKSWYSRDTSGLDIINIVQLIEFEASEHLRKSGFEIPFLNTATVIGNKYENPELLNTDQL